VISIVDQFLEHSRIYYFENNGDPEVYLSSADLMQRNLDKRIEILFLVDDPACQKRLVEILDLYFRDTQKSWILLPDGSYTRTEAGNRKKLRVQEYLCQRAIDEERAARKTPPQELKPQRPSTRP
jgi:polyphosphate kinase